MRPKHLTYTPADASLTGFASNVTGATWTLTATSSGDSCAHQVSIRNDSITDHSGKTALLTGTDAQGNSQTETVTLPGPSATVESTLYFLTLTSIVPSATIGADTMDIGWVDEFATPLMQMDLSANNGAALGVYVTGTINYTVQETMSKVQVIPPETQNLIWVNSSDPAVVSQTANKDTNFENTPVAIRVIVNSYSSGATLAVHLAQSGYY